MSDEDYTRGQRIFLQFAGVFACVVGSVFAVASIYFGFFYHGPHAPHAPAYRVIVFVVGVAILGVDLAIEGRSGKVRD